MTEKKPTISVPADSLLKVVRKLDLSASDVTPHDFTHAFDDLRSAFSPEEVATGQLTRSGNLSEQLLEAMQSIWENDATEYDHHQKRKIDGKSPREVSGGTIFLRPKDIAYRFLKAAGRDPFATLHASATAKDAS